MIDIKLTGVAEVQRTFNPSKVARAAASTLNRVTRSGRTEASSSIRARWMIKKAPLDRKMTITPASKHNLRASLTVISSPLNLMHFYARQTKRGVVAQIQRGRKTILPHAFIARGSGGTLLVLRRSKKAKSRTGRKEGLAAVKVISAASMFHQQRLLSSVTAKIQSQWQKEWDNQVQLLRTGRGWITKG